MTLSSHSGLAQRCPVPLPAVSCRLGRPVRDDDRPDHRSGYTSTCRVKRALPRHPRLGSTADALMSDRGTTDTSRGAEEHRPRELVPSRSRLWLISLLVYAFMGTFTPPSWSGGLARAGEREQAKVDEVLPLLSIRQGCLSRDEGSRRRPSRYAGRRSSNGAPRPPRQGLRSGVLIWGCRT
jgi:hypothetical protein